ncbi:nitroreductase family protein [uncultured Tateyamaria sp.]|uniref:nitroreductase family protein n=1 Tax=uncultured Tateyamaria sp. TaxID=455651 RepID=UPI0026131349|nr:nitroreductase family protein [uncultured Tateyamaria sp.]
MQQKPPPSLRASLAERFSDAPDVDAQSDQNDILRHMAAHASCRAFLPEAVSMDVLKVLCATALSSPSKSDLQQRDIVLIQSPEQRSRISDLVSGQAWVADAPVIAVFCGNNRRHRLAHEWHDIPFANDHLDAMFNAAADAAIALGAFVTAAQAVGLGCCPISAVRNEAEAVSDLLGLPDHVFPFAGLAIGVPRSQPDVSKRLPLSVTCHVDRYGEDGLENAVRTYDAERAQAQPYAQQRFADRFGASDTYGWSEDKARQYSAPERADFGAFIRRRGFSLD